jgi:hypothetical protein
MFSFILQAPRGKQCPRLGVFVQFFREWGKQTKHFVLHCQGENWATKSQLSQTFPSNSLWGRDDNGNHLVWRAQIQGFSPAWQQTHTQMQFL